MHETSITAAETRPTINPLEKIEELLTCAVCLDRYIVPKLLPCQHTFCMEPCLDGLADSVRKVVKCPECRAEHQLPFDGVKGFQSNYTMMGFLEVHIESSEDTAADLEAYIKRYNMERCKLCNEKAEVEECAHCDKKICGECQDSHREMLRRDLTRLTSQVKRLASRINDAAHSVKRGLDNLSTNVEQVREEIQDHMKRFTKELKKREDELLTELDTFSTAELRLMRVLKDNLEVESTNIGEALTNVDSYMSGDKDFQMEDLVKYKVMFTQGLEYLRLFNPDAEEFAIKRVRFQLGQDPPIVPHAIAQFGELHVCTTHFNKYQAADMFVPRFGSTGLESDNYRLKRNAWDQNNDLWKRQFGEDSSTNNRAAYGGKYGRQLETSRYDATSAMQNKRNRNKTTGFTFETSPWARVQNQTGSVAPVTAAQSSPAREPFPRVDVADTVSDDELSERINNIRRINQRRQCQVGENQPESLRQASPSPLAAYHTAEDLEQIVDPLPEGSRPIAVTLFSKPVSPNQVAHTKSSETSDFRQNPLSDRSESSESYAGGVRKRMVRSYTNPGPASPDRSRSTSPINSRHEDDFSTGSGPVREDRRSRFKKRMQEKCTAERKQSSEDANEYVRRLTRPNDTDYKQKSAENVSFKFGAKGAADGQFNWPRGVVCVPITQEIAVCDSSNHRVQIFDNKGVFQKAFGCYGSSPGSFDCLAGICINKYKQFVVTDRYNHRVQIFDMNGRFLRQFGEHGTSNGHFNSPWGVCVDNQGFIYVCDKDNHRVQIFQSDGNFVAKFGGIGTRDGLFQNPHFVACSRNNQLVVTDCSNHRVQVFDHNGHFQFSFGSEGFAEGQFKYPRGVAVDSDGMIVVADGGNNRVQVFCPDGRFYTSFGTWGTGSGQLKQAEGLAIMSDGRVVVTDRENHRVQVY